MEDRIELGSFRGERRADGTIIGFDYQAQMWVDTHLVAERDAAAKPGSASNPLRHLRDLPRQV